MSKKKQYKDLEDERYGLFGSEESFDLDIEYGRDFLRQDNVQFVTLYKVNIIKTKSHKLYGQTKPKNKVLMEPVKLNVMITVEPSNLEYYGNVAGGISRQETGKLVFGVYLKELNEKNTEINRGDYIEYNLSGEKNRYYEVENAEEISDTTERTIGGFKAYYKEITCTPVKEDVLKLFQNNTKGR